MINQEIAYEQWGSYRSPYQKPADFDAFWQKAKQEVENLSLAFQLTPYPLPSKLVEAFELRFQGVGEAEIYCQYLRPKNSEDKKLPALLQFHGYHVSSGDWSDKVALAAEGIAVFALDVRGQGGKSQDRLVTTGGTVKGHVIRGVEDGPNNLYYKKVYQDLYQLTRVLQQMDEIDPQEMMTYGVSQGGALALVAAALSPSIRKAFVQYPFLSDFREAYQLDQGQSAYEELAYWFRFRDPLHKNEKKFFETLDYIDIKNFAPWIRADVFWGMGLEDRICHPKLQFAVWNELQTKKELSCYPEYGHEYLPGFSDEMRKRIIE